MRARRSLRTIVVVIKRERGRVGWEGGCGGEGGRCQEESR